MCSSYWVHFLIDSQFIFLLVSYKTESDAVYVKNNLFCFYRMHNESVQFETVEIKNRNWKHKRKKPELIASNVPIIKQVPLCKEYL